MWEDVAQFEKEFNDDLRSDFLRHQEIRFTGKFEAQRAFRER